MNEKYWTGTPAEREREIFRVAGVLDEELGFNGEYHTRAASAIVPPLKPEPPCVEWSGWRVTWDGNEREFTATLVGGGDMRKYPTATTAAYGLSILADDTLVTRLLALKGGERAVVDDATCDRVLDAFAGRTWHYVYSADGSVRLENRDEMRAVVRDALSVARSGR